MNNNRFNGQPIVDERYHQHYEASSPDSSREAAFFYTMNENSRRMLFTPQYFDPDLLKVCKTIL